MLFYIGYVLDRISLIFELTGALLICLGGVYAVHGGIRYWIDAKKHRGLNHIRLELGKSMLLGLDFFVCGDLVRTIGTQDYYSLGLLFVLVIIRTILSYFLSQEIIQLSG
jgi:uncharacterized membrane protein